MNYEEAMKAARAGHKVAPANLSFFVYYHEENSDFGTYRRVTPGKFGSTWMDEDFHPSVYEKMMTWVIYKKDPLSSIKNAIKRVFGNKLQLNFSSNPS